MISRVFQLSDRITLYPVMHESGDFSVAVRRVMATESFDCLAVPLPRSFQPAVEQAILNLPRISLVVQKEGLVLDQTEWDPDDEDDSDYEQTAACSYVCIDPCQPVIAALRAAMEEHIPRAFIDLETDAFESHLAVYPDAYSLKHVTPEALSAAILPAIPPPVSDQAANRVHTMAARLRELERSHRSILCVCSLLDWPWIREAYQRGLPAAEEDAVYEAEVFGIEDDTLLFALGELPFITSLYEQARAELDSDENLSIDGIKTMLLAARDKYRRELGSRARSITPKLLRIYLQYVRNLTLMERRLTPTFYTLVIAAQQIAGDYFAIKLAEIAGEYLYKGEETPEPLSEMGVRRLRLPDGWVGRAKSRLPGHPRVWKTCRLEPLPPKAQQERWESRWNPFHQCSWPPEDIAIEKFRTHVKDAAIALLGTDLARTEKFSTSLKDGLDIRETLRQWHTGELYVKVNPPARQSLDCVVMLFDSPADPRDYPWRVTWHAESHDESTLALFATDFRQNMVGPGIGLATYGGAMFLFPPRPVADIWRNPRFDAADTLEDRLIMAACHYAREKHIALLSPFPPGTAWKRIASRAGKRLLHLPLSRFSQETIQQLRMFHVLNGTQVRSYAMHFIRKA